MTVTATPAGPDSYGRFMRVRIFDCWMHEHDIRDAIGAARQHQRARRPRVWTGARRDGGQHGIRRRQAGWRARRVAGLDRADGPTGRTINVAIEGRGRVVDDFGDDDPTSTIRLDGLLFTRLAGGRTPLAQHADAIAYGGDEAVGRRVVEHLNYVI